MRADTNTTDPANTPEQKETSFAETALTLGGKSADEARRTGAIDSADDQVEKLFQPQYQTANSPAHRAVWDRGVPIDLFQATPLNTPPEVRKVMDDSLAVVRGFRESKSIQDDKGKIRNEVLEALGDAGYWGLLVDKKYGGSGTPFRSFAPFLTEMAMIDPTLAGLASVHGCIGAVDPVSTFGNDEQKQRYLPKLASGERLSAFALTEPCAGSDLTALRTHAKLDGDSYILNGEKLFITNVVPGRTIGVVCLIDDVPNVLVVDLPPEENDQFQLRKYGIWALKHTHNQGIIFKDFRVPKENLLLPGKGNGLTIAYHGLNLGRVSLCANAAGTMRLMMASMIPWVHFRETYGEPIAKRELVQRRLGKLAGMIVASDALVAWCSTLIDAGYRGEMECIIAKIFGSESQKEAAIELFMKTHGGRSFLHGHLFGDNVHEYLAPCIYEGEGEMLGMAFFKSLVKKHGTQFFEPIGKALHAAGIKKPNPLNPAHAWALKGALMPYAGWYLKELVGFKPKPQLPKMPAALKAHAEFAAHHLQHSPLKISGTMRKHQLKLADRQCRMSYLSQNVQNLMTILATALYAANHENETVQAAADIACRDLKRKFLLTEPSDRYFRRATEVGGMVAEGNFPGVDVPPDEILMRYDK
ncbi:acyl-CoA dehydrogenase [bacterium]|nr:acyl-CoA dehydrogenase [bacterium]